jgi:phosphoglycolate phosphatase-like HAD superfamily hydrolase
MDQYQQILQNFRSQQNYLIAIDSDGCAFDTMELKHRQCFSTAFVESFQLHDIEAAALETWNFVNLYSNNRGINRFKGLLLSFTLLKERFPGLIIPAGLLASLDRWISEESSLSMDSLEKMRPELEQVYEWSALVNRKIASLKVQLAPFSPVSSTLIAAEKQADLVVASSANLSAIEEEWKRNNLKQFVQLIAGQEMGSKTEILQKITSAGYPEAHMLMIGDAPGDLKAARANKMLFFPVLPGKEEESWQRLSEEGLKRFFSGNFDAAYQQSLIETFESTLSDRPPWIR